MKQSETSPLLFIITSCIKQWNNKSSRWGFVFWLTDSGQPYPWIETLFPFYFSQHCSYVKCDRKWILCYLGWVFVVWHGMLHFLDWNVRTRLALIAWNKFKIKTAPKELQNTCTKLTVLKKLCPTILILYSSIFWKTWRYSFYACP